MMSVARKGLCACMMYLCVGVFILLGITFLTLSHVHEISGTYHDDLQKKRFDNSTFGWMECVRLVTFYSALLKKVNHAELGQV